MFAALYTLQPHSDILVSVARQFSPRFELFGERLIAINVDGLDRLCGTPQAIAQALRHAAADRGCAVHVAIAGTRTAAVVLAQARAGVTVVAPGGEAAMLAMLPIRMLELLTQPDAQQPFSAQALSILKRWGVKTLGELAVLPSVELSERLGQTGLAWQRVARGQDVRPLVPDGESISFEQSLELEWPIEGLEPLSFVLGRLLDPLAASLERADRAAAVLAVRLRLVDRTQHERTLQLPSPIRDPRVLRTLIVLDLESHPPALGIDAVTIAIEPTASRVVQGSLLTRTVPAPEQLSPLLARLGALMGEERCGAASLVDSYRPGAFRVTPFSVNPSPARNSHSPPPTPHLPLPPPHSPPPAVRRYRVPVAARVTVQEGRPVLVRTDRRGIAGGRVEACAGPWRTSGEWWGPPSLDGSSRASARQAPPSLDGASRVPAGQVCGTGWNRDEWDVALGDGAVYRLFEDRESARWFIEGVVD